MPVAWDGGGAGGGWPLAPAGGGAGQRWKAAAKDRIKKGERKREVVKPQHQHSDTVYQSRLQSVQSIGGPRATPAPGCLRSYAHPDTQKRMNHVFLPSNE